VLCDLYDEMGANPVTGRLMRHATLSH